MTNQTVFYVATELDNLRAELAAAHAVIAQMREAIQHHHDPACQQMQGPYGEQWRNTSEVCTCWVSDALALPIDDTALRAQLKEERERCARYCEGTFELGGDALNCAAGTRNLGDE